MPLYTPAPAAAIGGAITGATLGSVLFADPAGVFAQDNANLFFDNTNNRLGVRTAAPAVALAVDPGVDAGAGIIGRSRFDSRDANSAVHSHTSHTASGADMIQQTLAGQTRVNAASGQNVVISFGGSGRFSFVTGGNTEFSSELVATSDLGRTGTPWKAFYLAEFQEMTEMVAPANPAANKGRLYLEDNGAGKTRLVVKFNTGAGIVLATEV